jgi:hypothetical protein
MSKRPYTIRGTERFATSRSQGSGGAAGRAVGGKIASAGGVWRFGEPDPLVRWHDHRDPTVWFRHADHGAWP